MLDTVPQRGGGTRSTAGTRRNAVDRDGAKCRDRAVRPKLQAAFCIDVRSEVFRRALESLDPGIQTLGFAGFFGLTTAHRGFASDETELRLPVLLNPGATSRSGGPAEAVGDQAARFSARADGAWGRFKLAAVSSFAFVEAMGPVYVGRLLRDSLALVPKSAPADPAPRFDPEPDPEVRIGMAENILRAMSLTRGFAPLVLLVGHGSGVTNNPHASALQCGACGGYSGEVNARLLAGLLNDPDVRRGLSDKGIAVPVDTLFLGALHDTVTDRVTVYDQDAPAPEHREALTVRTGLVAQRRTHRAYRACGAPSPRENRSQRFRAQPRLGGSPSGMGIGRMQRLHRRAQTPDTGHGPGGTGLPA